MKKCIVTSIFVCLFFAATTYGQDRPPNDSGHREGDRTSCIQSPGAVKDYVEKETDKVTK